jgi:hypothetical protein
MDLNRNARISLAGEGVVVVVVAAKYDSVHHIAVSVGCINDRKRLQQGADHIIRRTV